MLGGLQGPTSTIGVRGVFFAGGVSHSSACCTCNLLGGLVHASLLFGLISGHVSCKGDDSLISAISVSPYLLESTLAPLLCPIVFPFPTSDLSHPYSINASTSYPMLLPITIPRFLPFSIPRFLPFTTLSIALPVHYTIKQNYDGFVDFSSFQVYFRF